MPTLRDGGGNAAIVAAAQSRLVYPPRARRDHVTGRVFVSFTVTAGGLVSNAHVVKGLRPDCDTAAVRAVRQLPQFTPARQLGRAVACGFTLPVRFALAAAVPASRPAAHRAR